MAPNTQLQIWFGLLMSGGAVFIISPLEPYRDPLCASMQKFATLQIFLTYVTATVFYVPESLLGTTQSNLQSTESLAIALIVINLVAFIVLLIRGMSGMRSAIFAPIAYWANSGHPLVAHRPQDGGYHAFVSHNWARGQDAAKIIKTMLISLVPSLSIFLDVDDLHSITELELCIDRSDVVRTAPLARLPWKCLPSETPCFEYCRCSSSSPALASQEPSSQTTS